MKLIDLLEETFKINKITYSRNPNNLALSTTLFSLDEHEEIWDFIKTLQKHGWLFASIRPLPPEFKTLEEMQSGKRLNKHIGIIFK